MEIQANGALEHEIVAPAAVKRGRKPKVAPKAKSVYMPYSVLNQSGIHPTKFCVLVLPDKADDSITTESGFKLYKPVDTIDKEERASQTGTIIEVSPLAFTYEIWPDGARKPQIGDKVIFAKYAGFLRRGKDAKDYRIMEDKDVLATVD